MRVASRRLLDLMIGFMPVAGMAGIVILAGWTMAGMLGGLATVAALGMLVSTGGATPFHHPLRQIAREPRRKRLSAGFRDRLSTLVEKAGFKIDPPLGFVEGPPNAYVWHPGPPGMIHLVVSESLHDLLTERQLLAVLAHELAHVRAGDGRRMALGQTLGRLSFAAALVALLGGTVAFLFFGASLAPDWAWWTLALGPTALSALHHATSRRAEFRADAEAARLTGDAAALSQALGRIHFVTSVQTLRHTIEEYAGIRGRGWWRTHPAMEDRIDRLQRTAARQASTPG
ncbi:MAG: M48 family metalloprotease [Minwuia sp.]|uniref:M48 family metalloprotease n=1 Tax=Minwuia sp. TaxID=2493630 RepID=UPI003A879EDC